MPGGSLLTSKSLLSRLCKEQCVTDKGGERKRGTDDDELVCLSPPYTHTSKCPDRVSNRSLFVSATSGRQWNSRLGPRATTTSRTSCDAQLDLRLAPPEENIDCAAGPEYHLHSHPHGLRLALARLPLALSLGWHGLECLDPGWAGLASLQACTGWRGTSGSGCTTDGTIPLHYPGPPRKTEVGMGTEYCDALSSRLLGCFVDWSNSLSLSFSPLQAVHDLANHPTYYLRALSLPSIPSFTPPRPRSHSLLFFARHCCCCFLLILLPSVACPRSILVIPKQATTLFATCLHSKAVASGRWFSCNGMHYTIEGGTREESHPLTHPQLGRSLPRYLEVGREARILSKSLSLSQSLSPR
ncbi:hypothetical protein BDP55DRAFT_751177 [Colletotrichum godetiae]|uniref:Uncharacterized protein n=1 Tax=Colletotrichum godetiae TaxID=1209918 RepID=A0AAJ0B0A5_9PEZI|nr:uncharacterized protein BDP55DRAFT_751177 [Colletotrichum godetiae]KAK1691399.1 hypothetical protein BDP55DRAFT_751177 [Colletotrichum godetiae]